MPIISLADGLYADAQSPMATHSIGVTPMTLAFGQDIITNDQRLLRLPSLEAQLAAWTDAVERGLVSERLHLQWGGFRLYVRRSHRDLGGRKLQTLDIASIDIPKRFRGRGWFRSFRTIAEALNPWEATYYEMVNNSDLAAHLTTAGLKSDTDRCFYSLATNCR